MEQVVIQFSADISKLLPAIEAFEKVGLIDKKNGDIFKATSAEYSKRNQIIDQTIVKNKELDKTISSGAMEHHTIQIKENSKAIKGNADSSENLITKLREMQKELIKLEAAGLQNTQKFKDLTKQAGELKDTINDLKERVKSFASDTRRLDAVVQSFRLMAGSMAAMQGAFTLFGQESKELRKDMIQLQAAMAILAGVVEVAEFVTGQSALKTMLLDGAQKLVAISARAMGVSVGTATAIMTGGATIIIGLVASLMTFTDEEEKNTLALEKNKEEQKKYQETLRDTNKELDKSNRTLQQQIKLIGLTGAAREKESIIQEAENATKELLSKEENVKALKAYEEYKKIQEKKGKDTWQLTKEQEKAMLNGEQNGIKFRDRETELIIKGAKTGEKIAEALVLIEEKKNAQLSELRKQNTLDAIQKNQKLADDAYNLAVANAQADLLAQQQIEANRKRQLQIETNWNRDRAEIDMMYQQIVQEGNLTTSEAIYTEIEKRLQANADYYNKLLTDDAAANKQLATNANTQTEIQVQYKKSQADIDDMYAKIAGENAHLTSEQIYAIIKKQLDDEVKATEDAERKKEELRKQSIQFAKETLQQLADFAIEQQQREIETRFENNMAALDREKAAVLENQNLTEAQKLATEEYFENRRKKLQIEKFKETQRLNIQAAIINTALAVTSALAAGPYPAAFFTAAGAAVAGALQVAKIRSTPVPQFAEGVEFLEGAGDGTSDSIPAMLSRGERVVPAKTNKDYFDGLSVIHNRLVAPELVNTLLTNLAENGGMLAAPTEAITQLEQQFGIDYARLGKEFQKGRTQVSINIDEKGFTKHIQQGLNRSTYHNQKFRFKQ